MAEKDMIEISHLCKQYGNKVAVNDLSLKIRQGEVFGLLGPNGAGKTTTILMLLGLTEPTSGKAEINGLDCAHHPLEVKSKVGYMPDNVGFYTDMTGRANLRFTGKMNGLSGKELEDRIDMLLNRVGMTYAADKKTGTYSKGMRQRLGLADILIKDPEVIVMDEPTLGIDPEGMRELLLLIRELAEKDGKTILISSHQLHQIQQVCDRVGIFVDGNLIASGTLEELEEEVRKDGKYSLEIGTHPCDQNVLKLLYEQPGVEDIKKEGNVFLVTSTTDLRFKLTEYLGQNGYTILHLHQRGGDLDEIYRRYFEQAEKQYEEETQNKKKKKFLKHEKQKGGRTA